MNRDRIIASIVCFVASTTLAVNTLAQGPIQGAEADRERAAAIWEETIRAKGGHERLQSVENLLISSTIDTQAQRGDAVTETERLYAMPGKAWIYTYTPSFDVSVDATVINNERNFCMVTLSPALGGVPSLSICVPTTPLQYLIQDPVIYLMETRWVRPVPVHMRTEGKGRKQVDVIETEVGKLRVDFYLDRKTRLPIKLVTDAYYGVSQLTQRMGLTVELNDYVAVDGIQMPRRVTREPYVDPKAAMEVAARDLRSSSSANLVPRRDTESARYRFNVAYDPTIFDRPVSRKVKRYDWKLRRD